MRWFSVFVVAASAAIASGVGPNGNAGANNANGANNGNAGANNANGANNGNAGANNANGANNGNAGANNANGVKKVDRTWPVGDGTVPSQEDDAWEITTGALPGSLMETNKREFTHLAVCDKDCHDVDEPSEWLSFNDDGCFEKTGVKLMSCVQGDKFELVLQHHEDKKCKGNVVSTLKVKTAGGVRNKDKMRYFQCLSDGTIGWTDKEWKTDGSGSGGVVGVVIFALLIICGMWFLTFRAVNSLPSGTAEVAVH